MSQMAHHWEALRRQRVVDRKNQALKRMKESEAAAEIKQAELAAEEERNRQAKSELRKKELKAQVKDKDKNAVKKSFIDRDREIQRLMMERSWHNSLINRMEEAEKAQLMHELERDHFHKAKLLRDHGLYRGHKKFFTEPEVY